jgi:hypothetical protein
MLISKCHRTTASLFTFIILLLGSIAVSAQSPLTGNWRSSAGGSSDKIQISFERTRKNGRNTNSHSFAYSDLQGLDRSNAENGNAQFSFIREAGTIQCSGKFKDGKGSGTFIFTPDQSYINAMRSRGFDFLKTDSDEPDHISERLFTAAMLNVTTALADDLNTANFGPLDADDLFKAAIFKIDGAFMAEMKATGFPDLSMEDLVKARIFKIDSAYVRDMRNTGLPVDKFESLVKYSIFKVTPEYLTELRNVGLVNLSTEDVVKLRIFKVDAEYVRNARATEPNISIEKIVRKKIGVPNMDINIDTD